jgi:hypothetical protein
VRNLDNNQQAARIQYEKLAQSVLTDAAAQNAAKQMNMTEANQQTQYFAGIAERIGTNNANQANAQSRVNAGELNANARHNSDAITEREKFNATNQIAIEQSNAVWRREIATINTAAINFQNQTNAQNVINLSEQAYDNLWQEYRDVMEMALRSVESELDRVHALQVLAVKSENSQLAMQYQADRENSAAIGGWLGDIFTPFAEAGVESLISAFL